MLEGFLFGRLFRLSLLAFLGLLARGEAARQKTQKELKHTVPSGAQSPSHKKTRPNLKFSVS